MSKHANIFESGYVTKDVTLAEAMIAITANKKGSVVVVDEEGTLLGVASDGDLRRAMVRGATNLTPISKCINTNPLVMQDDKRIQGASLFEKHQEINLIPVINKMNRVVDVVVRDIEPRV